MPTNTPEPSGLFPAAAGTGITIAATPTATRRKARNSRGPDREKALYHMLHR